jgi:Family of unknown function (DUF5681)
MIRKPSDKSNAMNRDGSEKEYRVGPGRPPKEFQFKPGQSGNPKGAKHKPPSIAKELKHLLERALRGKVTLRQGTRERMVSLAAAGIEQLVNQFAKGDRHARRDLIVLAEKLGVNLAAGQEDAIQQALARGLSTSDQALLNEYVERHRAEHDLSRDPIEPDSALSKPNDPKPPK